jgi:uncharacterized protein YdeI (YjbR/CyaY-like superfamily)
MPDALDTLAFPTRTAFAAWLEHHHATSPGLWLKLTKKGCEVPSVTYAEAVDVALCHGWIDGQKRPVDERFWLQRFTPRSPRSGWSKINCDKADALVASGHMRPAGQRQVDLAKADGRWAAAYAGSRTITVPEDLASALAANPKAAAFFATLDRANRYAVLYRVHQAKRPTTRARRIEQFVAMLAEGRTIHA